VNSDTRIGHLNSPSAERTPININACSRKRTYKVIEDWTRPALHTHSVTATPGALTPCCSVSRQCSTGRPPPTTAAIAADDDRMQLQTCSGKPSHDEHQARRPAMNATSNSNLRRAVSRPRFHFHGPGPCWSPASLRAPVRTTSRSSFYYCAALRAYVGRGRATVASYLSSLLLLHAALDTYTWSQGLTSIAAGFAHGAPCSLHSSSSLARL
jgi:hypothetical protein